MVFLKVDLCYIGILSIFKRNHYCLLKKNTILFPQKPANILVMGEGPERGRVKIGMLYL